MPVDIVIPNFGESVTSGVVVKWLKNDGEYVKRDEDVLEFETDKITAPITAPAAGLLKRGAKEGDEIKVGGVVGSIDDKAPAPAKSDSDGRKTPAEPAPAAASPAPAPSPAPKRDDARATPLARKTAQERGVDLAAVRGTWVGGRVREQDVLAAPAQPPETREEPPSPDSLPRSRRERMSPLRQRVAARLVEAQRTAAMLTTFNECDMSAVIDLRKHLKDTFEKRHNIGLGFMSFFVKAAVHALSQFPSVNASIVPGKPGQAPEIEFHDHYDISVAIGTPRGLVVPVLRDCRQLSFADIERAIKDLASRARDGKLTLAQLQGGTFTITNGGIYGSLLSTPILNPPQSGILGMHAIKPRPVEHPAGSGQVAVRPMMYLALSYDHRLVDGAEAVQFLIALKNAIEEPSRLLVGV